MDAFGLKAFWLVLCVLGIPAPRNTGGWLNTLHDRYNGILDRPGDDGSVH